MKMLVATTNPGKLREFKEGLKELPVELLSLRNFGSPTEVLEDGESFEENALKKASAMSEYSGILTLADDSGLEVDALGGEPGIHSARFAGEKGNDRKNNELLLRRLAGLPPEGRRARFVCVLALCQPSAQGRQHWLFRGVCEGRIDTSLNGKQGFGYDPLFLYPPLGMTFAQMDPDTKARVSHRGKALEQLRNKLPELGIIA